jgi:PEGA domain
MPGGMYQRAEIRAYAKAVGLDQALALSELERALGTRAAPADPHSGSRQASGLRHRAFLALALTIAIALLGMVAWYSRITPLPSDDGRAIQRGAPAVREAEAGGAETGGANAPPPQQTEIAAIRGPEAGGAEAPLPQQAAAAAGGLITELVVVSDPPGARVIVDGIGRGTTPVTIRYLSAGEKRVRVLKDGFSSEERTIRQRSPSPSRAQVSRITRFAARRRGRSSPHVAPARSCQPA